MGTSSTLSSRAIRGMFYKRLEETTAASWVSTIGSVFNSDQESETYRFLGQVPALRAWRGARSSVEPRNFGITIINDKYEAGVNFARDDIRRDKTPQIRARIGDLASRAACLPQKVFTTLLEGNGNAYDGNAFFADRTSATTGKVNNAQTDSGVSDPVAPTTAEMAKGILKTISIILSAKDDQGEPYNEFATSFAVMVPTLYWSATIGALGDEYLSTAVSNTLKALGVNGPRALSIMPIHNPRLATPSSTGIFYTFRTDAEVKSLIWQDEVESQLESLEEGSDHAYFHDEHIYGVQRIGAGGFGMHELACRMTFS
jgi:phage major head subunit gpT-like protein